MEILYAILGIFTLITMVRVYVNWFRIDCEKDWCSDRRRALQRQIDHLTILPELQKQIETYKELGGERKCTPDNSRISVEHQEGIDYGLCHVYSVTTDISEFREKYILPLLLDEGEED